MAGGSPYITDAIWWLWEWCATNIPGARLGGIYANKSGYHNTVNSNKKSWPGNYSITLGADLTQPDNMARGFDLTLGPSEMMRLTGYLQRAALHPEDNRLNAMREFYGTLDTYTVYGLINTGPGTAWSFSSSDSSHLWHIHFSFFTEYCDDQSMMEAIASVLIGQTWDEWSRGGGSSDMLTAIQTTDTSGDTIIMLPWVHGWFRITKEKIAESPWNLQNAIDALAFAGVGINTTQWPGPYDFDNADIQMFWGQEIVFGGAGSVGPAGPKGDPGPKGDKGDPGEDGLGVGDEVTITGTVVPNG